MTADTFNAEADPESEGEMTQAKARKLYREAHQVAFPTRQLKSFKLLYITDPDAPGAMEAIDKMYKLYEKVFPIAEERESKENLIEALRANKARATGSPGNAPAIEHWVMVENEKGEIIAANNSCVFSAFNNPEVSQYVSGTTHLNYTFVDPAYRGQGHGERAGGYSAEKAREFIAGTFGDGRKPSGIKMLEIAEQNAVLKMTPEEILVDTTGAQTDQSKRRNIFETWGFRQLDLPSPYVQLPLEPRSEGGESASGMDLICRGIPAPKSFLNIAAEPDEVPAPVVKFHLEQFMKQAVSKGKYDINQDPDWVKQAQALDAVETVDVLNELDHMGMQPRVWARLDEMVNGENFDADAFSNKTMGEIMGESKIGPKAAPVAATGRPSPRIEWQIAA
jgi:hypothetical protein